MESNFDGFAKNRLSYRFVILVPRAEPRTGVIVRRLDVSSPKSELTSRPATYNLMQLIDSRFSENDNTAYF